MASKDKEIQIRRLSKIEIGINVIELFNGSASCQIEQLSLVRLIKINRLVFHLKIKQNNLKMDDLKNIVIQNLEQEGTLGSLRAQLRAQVFKAIENYADTNTKQSAGFQWQNPAANKIHEDAESKMMALLIREYLEYYKMDYTLSVYLPEVAMQGNEHHVSRDQLADQAGIRTTNRENETPPLLVQMLQNMRKEKAGGGSSAKKAGDKNANES